ncbi:MAG TPA: hypothetical protein VD866_30740 [Urbifossiella sp.]|nr:hypothetical protein [Urbifossiella sp.]
MSDAVTPEVKQARMTEFVKLMPLIVELAGLAKAGPGVVFSPDQIEGRAMSIRAAYKAARNLIRDVGENG